MFQHLHGGYRTFRQCPRSVSLVRVVIRGVLIRLFVEVSNPKLVVILGCFGLASNIVGLFLFHGMLFSVYRLHKERTLFAPSLPACAGEFTQWVIGSWIEPPNRLTLALLPTLLSDASLTHH